MPKKIEHLEDLTPDSANANAGTERGVYMVETSLEQLGAGRSILVDKNGNVIAGNKTLQAAVEKGLGVEVVASDGRKLVVVQRTDLDLTEAAGKARQLAYADNRASEVGLAWDIEQLQLDLDAGLVLDDWFHASELESFEQQLDLVDDIAGQLDSSSDDKLRLKKDTIFKVAFHASSIRIIEDAIKATGLLNRGDAFKEICEYYVRTEGQFDF